MRSRSAARRASPARPEARQGRYIERKVRLGTAHGDDVTAGRSTVVRNPTKRPADAAQEGAGSSQDSLSEAELDEQDTSMTQEAARGTGSTAGCPVRQL